MNPSGPIVCHVCWPKKENWNSPCPCVIRNNLRGEWAKRQYEWADKCLDAMGVPSIVVLQDEPSVPGMTVACRIQWLAWAIGAYGHEKIAHLRKESDDEAEHLRKIEVEFEKLDRETI